jgi:two-component system sensor histidine kinase/response regulator
MNLDYPSILFFLDLNNLFILSLFSYQYFHHHRKWYLLLVALGIMFQTVSIIIYVNKDVLSFLPVIRINNFLLISSFALTSFGLVSFDGKIRKNLLWVFLIFAVLFYSSIITVENNYTALSVIRIVACSFFYAVGAFYLFSNKNKYKFSLLLSSVLFIYSIFQLIRAVNIYQADHPYNFLNGSTTDDWFLIISVFIISTTSIGFIMLLKEIDQKTILEKSIKIQEDKLRLEELNLSKNKLFSIISHDLRNPFSSIIGLSELLKHSTKNKDVEESESLASMIHTTSKSTLVLLDNLLSWTKSQTGQMNFTPATFDLKTAVTQVLGTLEPIAQVKNISLNYDQSIHTSIYADENMLKTVLRNLISNGIKFTNTNGKIHIHAIHKPDLIEINVSDNGMGMDKDVQDQLFEANKTLTTLGTANEVGTGLGLLICKEFVKKNNGHIWVESQIGKGSKFKFTLPLKTKT